MSSSDPIPAERGHAALGAALVIAAVIGGFFVWQSIQQASLVRQAEAQVARWAEELDRQTSETGAYDRSAADRVTERDPWGTPLQVVYSQGGMAETVVVRSAGPDGAFHTPDDITRQGISANLHAIGEGIKQNVEDAAANAARGAVRGTVDGVKQSVKDAFSKKRETVAKDEATAADNFE